MFAHWTALSHPKVGFEDPMDPHGGFLHRGIRARSIRR
jgi:hypothetical protein